MDESKRPGAGGKRPGAGRPKGSRTKRTTPPPAPTGATPATHYPDAEAYLCAVVEGREMPDQLRIGAAKALLAYQRRDCAPLWPHRHPASLPKSQRMLEQRHLKKRPQQSEQNIKEPQNDPPRDYQNNTSHNGERILEVVAPNPADFPGRIRRRRTGAGARIIPSPRSKVARVVSEIRPRPHIRRAVIVGTGGQRAARNVPPFSCPTCGR